MTIIKKVTTILLTAVSFYLIVCLVLPNKITTESATEIKIPQDDAYAVVASFRNWQFWNTWIMEDSTIEVVFVGPETNVGAGIKWTGKKWLSGAAYITDFKPYEKIRHEFQLNDDEIIMESEFEFLERNNVTAVNWRMSYAPAFLEKPFAFFKQKNVLDRSRF